MNFAWFLTTFGAVFLVVGTPLLASVIPETRSNASSCFRAATLDHVMQVHGQDRHAIIELNLQVYASAAKLAKQNEADIVVFPEDGITFGLRSRHEVVTVGENIPTSKVAVCTEIFAQTSPIIHRLACIAKENQIFVTANVIDVQDCKSNCRDADQKYAFNTAVLFDRNGNFLAKYHKMHPFGERLFNVPPKDELIVVDTELGRLGMQVCFDMIYKTPGALLAAEKKIDTMLFPTLWFDELPFLGASQYQMSWSFGNKINLVASNIHRVEIGSMGSGIYAGGNGQFEVIHVADTKTRLLVASLPVNPSSNAQCSLNAKTVEVPQAVPTSSHTAQYWHKNMDLSETEIVKIDPNLEETSKCSRGVCCTLQYKVDKESVKAEDAFYLIVANRTRPGHYPWTEEFCGLVHCPEQSKPCAHFASNSPLLTKFTFAELSGGFSHDTIVYPSVIGSEHKVLSKADPNEGMWSYEEVNSLTNSKQKYTVTFGDKAAKQSHPVSTIGLYGRNYNRDPPYVQ